MVSYEPHEHEKMSQHSGASLAFESWSINDDNAVEKASEVFAKLAEPAKEKGKKAVVEKEKKEKGKKAVVVKEKAVRKADELTIPEKAVAFYAKEVIGGGASEPESKKLRSTMEKKADKVADFLTKHKEKKAEKMEVVAVPEVRGILIERDDGVVFAPRDCLYVLNAGSETHAKEVDAEIVRHIKSWKASKGVKNIDIYRQPLLVASLPVPTVVAGLTDRFINPKPKM